ncbi:MAG: hemerythrin domain-containing protein [Nitrospiraceae bacterium]|nr:hemerythrin domain-containing protein [Nitrospiraceae bacterium]
MMPVGPLMIEHRLIERMIVVMSNELERIRASYSANPFFIHTIVDFMMTYADQCHHGKEENILFRELKKKNLSQEHINTMDELVKEHISARQYAGKLDEANKRYLKGDIQALPAVMDCLSFFVVFYPKHIEKEDRHFFLPVMSYFSQEEKTSMLQEGFLLDQNLIHDKYKKVASLAESSYK